MRMAIYSLAIWLTAASAWAVEPPKMRELLTVMGFDVAIGATGHNIRNLKENIEGRTSEFDEVWDRTVDEFFPEGQLFDSYVTETAGVLTEEEWRGLMDYFSDGLGRRVTDMENAINSVEGREEKTDRGPAVLDRMKLENPERLVQVDRMLALMSSEEQSLAHAMNMSFALVAGLASTGQLPGAITERQILDMLASQAPQMRASIREDLVLWNVYTYRDLPNDELDAYIDFLAEEPAQKVYGALNAHMNAVMPPLVQGFATRVMEKMRQQEL